MKTFALKRLRERFAVPNSVYMSFALGENFYSGCRGKSCRRHCSHSANAKKKLQKPRSPPNPTTSAINLSMYNCASTTKIQLKKSGRHRWMVGLRLRPMPSHSFSHCRTMEKLSIKTTRSTDRKVVLRNSELLLMAIAPINASLGDQSRDFASYLRYSTKIEFALFPQRLTRAGTKACDWADGSVDEPVGSSP